MTQQQSRKPAEGTSQTLDERLLRLLSITPGQPEFVGASSTWDLNSALSLAEKMFPDFLKRVSGKRVMDFGCGFGWQSIALRQIAHAKQVTGVDTFPPWLVKCRELAARFGVEKEIEFTDRIQPHHKHQFDVVLSQSSFEHFPDPVATLQEMRSALAPGGELLITFHAPWYSPYGAHVEFFTRVPWVHLLFRESTVMRVRSTYRNDGAKKYEQVETGLNRMSISKFDRILKESGMKVVYRHNRAVKNMPLVNNLPVLKELFGSMVTAILKQP